MDINSLMDKYKNGDEKAFDKIYSETYKVIRALMFQYVGSSDVIEDLCQDVYTKLDKYKETFNGGNAFAFIYTIAKNTAIDYVKKKKELIKDEVYDNEIQDSNPYLHYAMTLLTDIEREIFISKVLIGRTSKYLAKYLGMSPSEVNKTYHLAKEKLKEGLGGKNNEF